MTTKQDYCTKHGMFHGKKYASCPAGKGKLIEKGRPLSNGIVGSLDTNRKFEDASKSALSSSECCMQGCNRKPEYRGFVAYCKKCKINQEKMNSSHWLRF